MVNERRIRGRSVTILSRGGIHGKSVGSSPASEKGSRTSTKGSPTLHCRARSSGKLTFKRSAHSIGCRSEEDQHGAEKAMGKGKGSTTEAQAHHVSSREKENRGSTKGKVGEVESGAEEGCLRVIEACRVHHLLAEFDLTAYSIFREWHPSCLPVS